MAVTLRFQSSGAVPGDGHPITMRGVSLTIGRGPENDVVLPDPDRLISKTHCVVENHNGNIVVVDFSTNGTFLNYGKIPLGRTATPINDGDVLIMGPYELVVQITSASSYAEPLAPLADERASFGNAKAAPDPYKLLDDAAPGGDFLDSLLGSDKPTGPAQFRKAQEDFVDLLPPLGDDGPLLGPAPELPSGPAMRDHSASITDSFLPAGKAETKSVIPDDWDDLLAPVPQARPVQPQALPPDADVFSHGPRPVLPEDDIFGGPVAAPGAGALPDDDLFMDLAPQPATAPAAPPPVMAPVAPPPVTTPMAASAPEVAVPPASPAASPFDPFVTDPNRPLRPDLAVPAAAPALSTAPVPPPAPVAAPVSAASVPVAPTLAPAPAVGAGLDAGRVFLMAVGAEDLRISDNELPETMARLGRTLRAMITGLREILMTRTSIKSEFRIEQTMVNVGGNNPLKFSVSPEQAIEAMVKPTARGYLPAEAAAQQALEDIKAHEIAMVTGMEAALKGVLAKLNPATLTTKIEARGGFGGFLKNRKAQYWETYEAMYAEISDQAENDFHELFAREFAQAYRAQLARLKEAKTQG
ncbi:type VI secretion system-associated FHA domain protein TagH [bacterium]|nr:type VI secretion system-associated FHA domain protein TagH [bacterium]